jgi:hypothetical protein
VSGVRARLDAEAAETGATDTMTEKQFEQIRERARVFPFGVPSQVQTDIAELIAERLRVGAAFEPEATDEAPREQEPEREEVRRTSGARKK